MHNSIHKVSFMQNIFSQLSGTYTRDLHINSQYFLKISPIIHLSISKIFSDQISLLFLLFLMVDTKYFNLITFYFKTNFAINWHFNYQPNLHELHFCQWFLPFVVICFVMISLSSFKLVSSPPKSLTGRNKSTGIS